MPVSARSRFSSCLPPWRFWRWATWWRAQLFQGGKFVAGRCAVRLGHRGGSAVGLLASTLGRLYSSTYYALRDTRTPLRFAIIRVALTTGLGYLCALPAAQVAGHRSALGRGRPHRFRRRRRLGGVHAVAPDAERAHRHDRASPRRWWRACGLQPSWAPRPAWAVKLGVGHHHPIVVAVPVLGAYGAVYFGATYFFRVEECVSTLQRVSRLASIGTRRPS